VSAIATTRELELTVASQQRDATDLMQIRTDGIRCAAPLGRICCRALVHDYSSNVILALERAGGNWSRTFAKRCAVGGGRDGAEKMVVRSRTSIGWPSSYTRGVTSRPNEC